MLSVVTQRVYQRIASIVLGASRHPEAQRPSEHSTSPPPDPIHGSAAEVGGEAGRHAPVREGRPVALAEPKDVGWAAGREGRQDALSVAGREGAGTSLDDPNPRIGREVRLEHAALDARLEVVRAGHGLEADLPAPIRGAGPTARGEGGEEGEGASHASRAPEASKKWKCRLSSLTPTRSPTRTSSNPGSRATSV